MRVTTLGEFAASIAHEVNQPLAAIVTNGEVSLRLLDQPAPDLTEVREAVGDLVSDARRASEVIGRLRALYERADPQRQRLRVDQVIGQALALVQHDLSSRDIAVRLDLKPSLPEVSGDPVQLQQVVVNLVVNGAESMADVDDRPRALTVRSRDHGTERVGIEIGDTGHGIAPGDEERIFDPFFTTKPNGLGMGLAICRSIVERHGGRLWVSRNAGRGATFRFTLPTRQGDEGGAQRALHPGLLAAEGLSPTRR